MSSIARDPNDSGPASPERLLLAAARAAQGAHERIAVVLADIFLPDATRLTDEQRIVMARLIAGLVEAIEDSLRLRLIGLVDEAAHPALIAALGSARVPLAAPILDRAALLRDPDLIAVLLRRTDEHRLSLRLASQRAGSTLADRLIDEHGGAVAEATMALLISESRRFDRFADPVLARTDLPAELQHRMVWRVAAALREYMLVRHEVDPVTADRVLVAAATDMLAGYDEGDTLEGRAIALAAVLRSAGLLDDALIADALASGHLALFAAGLGVRSAIEPATIWDMIADRDGSRLALLLRAIDMERAVAADILLRLALAEGEGLGEERLGQRVDAFVALPPDRARAAIAPWRLDADYRRAIAGLAAAGQMR